MALEWSFPNDEHKLKDPGRSLLDISSAGGSVVVWTLHFCLHPSIQARQTYSDILSESSEAARHSGLEECLKASLLLNTEVLRNTSVREIL